MFFKDEFIEGKEVILTLQDKDVLAEDPDVLVNVNMVDDESYKHVWILLLIAFKMFLP